MISEPADDSLAYALAFVVLSAYAIALIIATYWIARRAALGLEGRRKKKAAVVQGATVAAYAGWQLPFASTELSAIVEKELRYAMRNAQVRMVAFMPLILIFIRVLNSNTWSTKPKAATDFLAYGSGLLATGGILYVFLILAGLSCNLFAFEKDGMRTLILSPVDRRKILFGKNIAVTFIALIFSIALLTLNAIVFRDLTPNDLLFVALTFIAFAAISSTLGNWMSMRFPKHMQFGKRMNVSGMAGLLLIPMVIVLAVPPFAATLVGYFTQSLLNEYVTLLVLVLVSLGLYVVIINFHGRDLAKREIEILEAVREPSDE